MRIVVLAALAVFLTAGGPVAAGPISLVPAPSIGNSSAIEFVQAKKKSETVVQRIKRAWRSLTSYQFCARCPIIFPVTASTCSVSDAKSQDAARAVCATRNPLCYVNDGPC